MKIPNRTMTETVLKSGRHIWTAHYLLYDCGVRVGNDSHHEDYRRALRVLNVLAEEGILQRHYIAYANVTIFWRIP